jgi:Xaa-Pro aminopeptidase
MMRIQALRKTMVDAGFSGALISKKEDLYYFTHQHFSHGILIVLEDKAYLFVDGRYSEQASLCPKEIETVLASPLELSKKMKAFQFKEKIAFDAHSLSYASYKDFKKALGKNFKPASFFRTLRRKKDEKEIQAIEASCRILENAFFKLMQSVQEGISEKELATLFKKLLLEEGGDNPAFSPIVSFGVHTSYPHWTPTDTQLQKGDIVMIDCGVEKDDYHSDVTRTFFYQGTDESLEKCFKVVFEAYQKAFEKVQVGVLPSAVDKAARAYIEKKGYGEFFQHGLGHGVGLEIHEAPRLSPFFKKEKPFEIGDVFTIEPGIYLPKKGGVRLENTIVLEERGPRSLFSIPHRVENFPEEECSCC